MASLSIRKKMRTGIVCTLGPASDKENVLECMIDKGMTVARLNFSHGNHQEHFARMEKIRKLSIKCRHKVRILQDLEGFRIRLGRFSQPKPVEKGDSVCLTNSKATGKIYVPFDYDGDLRMVKKGMNIFIDDGKIVLRGKRASKDTIVCDVVVGGVLLPRKGVNIPELELDFEGVTAKDISDLGFAVMHGVDYIAQSFVRTADDVNRLREHIGTSLKRYKLIAKIESVQALHNIDKIIDAADMIMIARGDMGVVIPVYQVPFVQKEIIRKCRAKGKPVITATQMLESMTDNIIPTRAEVADVANAVIDGTDYVMLSGETAKGKYPVKAVEMMADTVRYTEAYMSASRFLILNGVGK